MSGAEPTACAATPPGSDRPGRIYEEERAEVATVMAPYVWYPQRTGRADMLIERAKAAGRWEDRAVRQEIAKGADACADRRMDGAARPRGAADGPAAGPGRLDRQARRQPRRARLREGAHHDRRSPTPCSPATMTAQAAWLRKSSSRLPPSPLPAARTRSSATSSPSASSPCPRKPATTPDRPFRDVPRNQVG